MDTSSKKKVFKILSIDGGGIKGLYSAKIIDHLEKRTGSPIGDYFDLIAGTSTGGLIALGLSLGKPASELVDFYQKHGPLIFANCLPFSRKIRSFQQLLFRSKYSAKELRAALEEIFEKKTIGDAKNLLCIPSYNLTLGKNRVFKFDHSKLPGTDNNISMVDVGLATSAAPTYFPVHKIENQYFVDGGVWANNPSMCALLEALKFFVGPSPREYDSVSILSVASLNHGGGFHLKRKWYNINYKRRSFKDWNSALFQTSLDGQSEFADFFLKSLGSSFDFQLKYARIPSYPIDIKNIPAIDLDKASKRSIEVLQAYGEQQGLAYRVNDNLFNDFFLTRKSYNV